MANDMQRRSTRNVLVNVAAKMIMMLLPFAIRSVMIYTLGNLYLGLDSLFASLLNMLSLSELGFSTAIVFAMYKPVAEKDDRKVRALLTFYRKVYFVVGCVILCVGLTLLPNIEWFIAEGSAYPQEINIHVVYLVLLLNTVLSYFLFAYKNAVLIATMRNDLDALLDLLRSILSHGLQIVVLMASQSYYLYILVLPVITVVNNLTRSYIIDKRYPQYRGKERLDKADQKDIMTRVGALIGNKIGGVVFTSVDSIVISSFLGLEILGKYSNYYTIFTAVYAVFSTAYTAIQSTVGNQLVSCSREENYSLFRKLFAGNAVLTCFSTCCFVFLYQPFMRLWVGEANLLGFEIPVLLAVYYFVKSTRRICFLFKEAAGMWRETWLMPYVSVTANLIVNILLVKWIGLPGVLLSSIFALAVIEIPWETSVFFRNYFKISVKYYLMEILFSILRTSLSVCAVGFCVYAVFPSTTSSFATLILRAAICFAITCLVYISKIHNLCHRKTKNIL
ncbi:MAG: oligosaccharide flippase family protein [Clostridia bacterium]|nr:oligosaccharide flippase family protein [Clostridia bacterium]